MLLARGLFLGALIAILLSPGSSWSQAAPATPQQGMGGIAGGMGAAPVYDEQKRPITAGGFVDSGTVVFQDITKAAGLSGWSHKMGAPDKKFIV
jgi:enediyne biosynthesis protein E4